MEFEKALEFRYACKRYDKAKEISKENIDKLIKAAHLTPTSCNMQHAHLLICESEQSMQNMFEICMRQGTVRTANKAIVVLAAKNNFTGVNTPRFKEIVQGLTDRLNSFLSEEKQVDYDTVSQRTAYFCDKPKDEYLAWSKANSYLVGMNIMNQAACLGIDSCAIEGFKQEVFDEKYPQFKKNYKVAMVISLGYRAENQPMRSRLNIEDLYTKI